MNYVNIYILIFVISALLISFAGAKLKGIITIFTVLILSSIISFCAIKALMGNSILLTLNGTLITGDIPLVIDPLSAWFILVINFTFITGVIYGSKYMEVYLHKKNNLSLHWISFLFCYTGITSVCIIQNCIAFLIAWEIMAVSAFFLVIFEGNKIVTIRAGINYLIQSHIVVLLLTIGFIWISSETNSFNFEAISRFAVIKKPLASFVLMLIFFVGFGLKAGFVPFHTWLPHAHPAAPSHISGIMSGVLIKIGIYGILRLIFLLNINYLAIGFLILVISVITGIYGVMMAIVQHNLKKLLAYHSIENIGIIGIGIGTGCIGIGYNNGFLSTLGFAGALLHTLNHSLFKSLLFYCAGNIYQSAHTMNIERFGGLTKRMPQTSFLFLLAAMAICGLPPFNGFISEFIIYSGLLNGLYENSFPAIILFIIALFGLALIGGLAILCFTKAYGTIFLGISRQTFNNTPEESKWQKLFPMYIIGLVIVAIGIFPKPFIIILSAPIKQLTGFIHNTLIDSGSGSFQIINQIGLFSLGFIILSALVFFIRKKIDYTVKTKTNSTWRCGYVSPDKKMQYTASSFVRNYRKLAEPLLMFKKYKKEVKGIFPGKANHQIHAQDKTEEYFINWPLRQFRYFLGLFSFLQNGKLQFYILYGMVFVTLLVGVPFIIYLIHLFVNFLNTL